MALVYISGCGCGENLEGGDGIFQFPDFFLECQNVWKISVIQSQVHQLPAPRSEIQHQQSAYLQNTTENNKDY